MLKEIDPSYGSFDVLDDPKRVAFVSKPHNFFKYADYYSNRRGTQSCRLELSLRLKYNITFNRTDSFLSKESTFEPMT